MVLLLHNKFLSMTVGYSALRGLAVDVTGCLLTQKFILNCHRSSKKGLLWKSCTHITALIASDLWCWVAPITVSESVESRDTGVWCPFLISSPISQTLISHVFEHIDNISYSKPGWVPGFKTDLLMRYVYLLPRLLRRANLHQHCAWSPFDLP